MKLTNNKILFLILIVASALRLYNYFEIPYTHDEFSALFRTHFNSFSELIEKGVKVDGHPAGIQVFLYYWTSIFGDSEWIVKLPFVICGILAVLLVYKIAREWYNESVALISASFLASIQFSIMYSQIARPYISGLFFSLLMVYYWSKIIRDPNKQFYLNSFLFAISASLCAYNHHFSLLFAAIVGISGLFFIQRQFLLKYIASGILIGLLYLPHLQIFLYQLKVGGVEGWLGKPRNEFILNYLGYIFDFSNLTYLLVASLVFFGLYKSGKVKLHIGHFTLFLSWFILPFLIGFFYSKYFNSVLQYSVLIFSFPFLFFILFGHIKQQPVKTNLILVLAILSVNSFAVIKERKHYELFYKSPYKQILIDHETAIKTYKNIGSIIDSNNENKKISQYYIDKQNYKTDFVWYDSFASEKDFIAYIQKQSQASDYMYFGCLSSIDPVTIPTIQDYFPEIEIQKNYAGATTFVFSKSKNNDNNLINFQGFESKDKKFWSSIDESKFNDSISYSGKLSYQLDEKTEWGPKYVVPLNDVITNENNFIDISAKVNLFGKCDEIILVFALSSNDKNIFWSGSSFDKFITNTCPDNENWITVHQSVKLSDVYMNHPNIQLEIYIWNKGLNKFLMDDFTIKLRKGNPVIYGLFEKI